TLEEHLRVAGALDSLDALAVIVPVLGALAHAHDRGIVHRDVTPANIVLAIEPDGQVVPKIVDFGIAQLPTPDVRTVEGRALGTPRYMAPERIRAQADIDGRADVFGAAVVLYEALTGVSPFAAPTPSASLAAVLETVVDPDPRIDPRLWIELQRALAKRAYERHNGAREFAAALLAAVGVSAADLEPRLHGPVPALPSSSDVARSPKAPAIAGVGGLGGVELPANEVATGSSRRFEPGPQATNRWTRLWRRLQPGTAAGLALLAGIAAATWALGQRVTAHEPKPTPAAAAIRRPEIQATPAPPEPGPNASDEALVTAEARPSASLPSTPDAGATGERGRSQPPRLPRPPHPKAVATTPGF
ncbi:MAG: protein kinase, partial [Polyangiaceae bacterium]|nr:protein kinase [Polyangiaceae bacterium]